MFNMNFTKLSPITQKPAPPCCEDNHHVVQAGDTLYAISRFYNISPDALIDANPSLEPDQIIPGQLICIPRVIPSTNCPTGASAYIVKKGDTFYSIAKCFKMRLSALLKANPDVNPDALLIGQSLCIPILSSTFISDTYRIRLLYPYRWSKIDNNRYAGIDGFLHVSAISGTATLKDICGNEAHHKLKPYGTHPVISEATLDGHEAGFIIPSADQPMEMRSQSALIVKYNRALELEGSSYQYLIIRTDKNHLRDIADTLEFLDE